MTITNFPSIFLDILDLFCPTVFRFIAVCSPDVVVHHFSSLFRKLYDVCYFAFLFDGLVFNSGYFSGYRSQSIHFSNEHLSFHSFQ